MSKDNLDYLLKRLISPSSLHVVGAYAIPETYGRDRVTGNLNWGRKYRFGNHPVRQHELLRDYGNAHLEALFESRSNAKALARVLNSQ